ncbi:Conjugative transposon protein TcpC [Actinacidiphila yanglinensis]|uniref:Conjugative transposon protein TcpC n=1 Tax=Actinacidiphila yanglinensis TaxID=310779 RepID=A0A1H6DKL9_9ACTN|nr:conjugal transfer protein [Actinacidiphila yanglinensis]SEG85671.1 Conjugative transposon protein TcpC [Actinacidiphila yanglinensis]
MKWRRRQGNATWVDEGVVGAGEMTPAGDVGGWSMTSGAAANRAALVRWAVWGVIVAGPLLGVAALFSAASAAGAPGRSSTVQAAPSADPSGTGPAGFAELYVSAYLSAGQGDQSSLAVFWPGAAQAQFDGEPGARQVTQVAAVRTVPAGGGLWSVTVAAQVIEPDAPATSTPAPGSSGGGGDGGQGPGLRYFQVAVAAAGADATGPWAYSALSAPAEVAAPEAAAAPRLVYGPSQPAAPQDARAQTVQQFLTAYLTGSDGGALDRFLSPGARMVPVAPAPYTSVDVEDIAAAGDDTGAGADPAAVPSSGAQQQVLVTVRATDRDGTHVPLAYAFTLTARAGRWEITSLDPGPLPAQQTGAPALTTTGPDEPSGTPTAR